MINLVPLCGGIPPAIAWRYLERLGDVVGAVTRQPADAVADGGLSESLQQLLPTVEGRT
jgi:hypothetical protein